MSSGPRVSVEVIATSEEVDMKPTHGTYPSYLIYLSGWPVVGNEGMNPHNIHV